MAASAHYSTEGKATHVDDPRTPVDPAKSNASQRTMEVNYTTTDSSGTYGVLEDGDTLYLQKPPKGAKWDPDSFVDHGALGTSVTMAIGIVGTTAKFKSAQDVSSAGVFRCDAQGGAGYEFDGDTWVIATIAGANADASIDIKALLKFYNFIP